MAAAEVQGQFAFAQAEMERVCKLLESPSAPVLDQCATIMIRVISDLEAGRRLPGGAKKSGGAENAAGAEKPVGANALGLKAFQSNVSGANSLDARRLQITVRRARALLDLACRFHCGWQRIVAGMSGGYTFRGTPAPLAARARVVMRG
jgi:hypothetical protein